MSLAKVAKLSKLSKEAAEELRKKIARDKAIKKANKDKKPTQKGLRLSKNKDIRMPDRNIDTPVVVGKTGITKTGEKINVGSPEDITRTVGSKKHAERKELIRKKQKEGTATKKELAELKAREKADKIATDRQGRGRRGKSTKTIAKSNDPFFRALEEAKKDGVLGKDYEKLLPNQKKQIVQAAKAFKKSEFEKDVRARIDAPKNAPISVGSAVENKRKIGMNKGGLKLPSAEQTGLKKLPTPVRNKMGYMYGGGMMKKPRMSSMDYRKGGLLLIAIDMMKKKKGKKEK